LSPRSAKHFGQRPFFSAITKSGSSLTAIFPHSVFSRP
jgi:hypothetical protein